MKRGIAFTGPFDAFGRNVDAMDFFRQVLQAGKQPFRDGLVKQIRFEQGIAMPAAQPIVQQVTVDTVTVTAPKVF